MVFRGGSSERSPTTHRSAGRAAARDARRSRWVRADRLRGDLRADLPHAGLRLRPRAADAEAAFAEELDRFTYSRYGNPTVTAFEERLRLLEGAEACYATATGMAAVFASLAAVLEQGSRVVASRALFGSTFTVLNEILGKWGVRTDYVDATDLEGWAARSAGRPTSSSSRRRPTRCRRSSTSQRSCELAHRAGAIVIVDNVFATPLLQQPLELGADVVVYSGHQAHRRPGPRAGRRDPGRESTSKAGAADVDPQHRPGAVAVQRVGAAQGAGDAAR